MTQIALHKGSLFYVNCYTFDHHFYIVAGLRDEFSTKLFVILPQLWSFSFSSPHSFRRDVIIAKAS